MQVAESGEAALEMLGSSPAFDVVVLDVMLPGKSGFVVMAEMRASSGQFIPTLMLTARGHPGTMYCRDSRQEPTTISPSPLNCRS